MISTGNRPTGFLLAPAVSLLLLAGCAAHEEAKINGLQDTKTIPEASLAEAQLQFEEGNYGSAATEFQKAVERTPNDAEAWLGLAASYDQIRRFDLADKAYERLMKLTGTNATLLNNMGYSYMLRGDLKKSKTTLAAAQRTAPDNPYVSNNIALLHEHLEKAGAETPHYDG